MDQEPRVVFDLLGSDSAPQPEVEAVELFLSLQEEPYSKASIVAFGNKTALEMLPENERLKKVEALKGVPMDVSPAFALRNLRDSTMSKGIESLSRGNGDVFLSAGNTGAVLAFSLYYLKKIEGIERPGILVVLPEPLGRKIIIDVGANSDCKPEHLLGFAKIGLAAARSILNKSEATVGLLNIGEEKSKGDRLRKESYELLEKLGKSFYGNIEPHDIFSTNVDVVVTDGFTGNILLKSLEGAFEFLGRHLKKTLQRGNLVQTVSALILKPLIKNSFDEFQYQTYGAALLAGLSHPVLIAHGRSDGKALFNALKYAVQAFKMQKEILKEFGSAAELETEKKLREKKTLFD